jgi:TonB family protein
VCCSAVSRPEGRGITGLNERKQSVLASDEEGATLDALRFSLATDIVELVVLTADEIFLQTLREAVGGARRLWHVMSGDKVSDLLVAGEVGILVLDVDALSEAPSVFIAQIKRQFPDLVIEVAGNRDAETALARLISAGIVYRFIHKPMSPARAKLFAEAAVKKFDEQRRRAAAPAPITRQSQSHRVLFGGAVAALAAIVLAAWVVRKNSEEKPAAPGAAPIVRPSPAESPLLAQAAAALAANRLTEPAGDNALDLYSQAQAHDPADAAARAGLAEVRERLLAKAENSLLEERLDEAAAAIATARNAGVDGARIAFLSGQLAKSRTRVNTTVAAVRVPSEPNADADRLTHLIGLATQRINEAQLTEPAGDSARFYVQESLRLDPNSSAAQLAGRMLAARLLDDVRTAVETRDFARAADLLDAAAGIATAPDIAAAQGLLAGGRREADAADSSQLLKNGTERMQQDRLVEPVNDSAKYYLLALRGRDPGHAGLAAATQDLGARLVVKARRALTLEQFDAAHSWLDEAAAIGFASPDASSVQHDLDAAVANRNFLTNIVDAGGLALVKSVQPLYPSKATLSKIEGWVELDFTVTEIGAVRDIAVHATSAAGMFEKAAISALSQWRYKPVVRDGVPKAQRARIRIRFVLAN